MLSFGKFVDRWGLFFYDHISLIRVIMQMEKLPTNFCRHKIAESFVKYCPDGSESLDYFFPDTEE